MLTSHWSSPAISTASPGRTPTPVRGKTLPGGSSPLGSTGSSFGAIRRNTDGTWDTSRVVGISALSLKTTGAKDPPTLISRPFHQAGNVISLREFTNSAFNHHHGIQSEE